MTALVQIRRRTEAREWAGRSAFVIACGLGLGWAGALLIVSLRGGPITDHGADLLATLGGAMAGAVATYLGSTLHTGGSARRREDQPPITTPEAADP